MLVGLVIFTYSNNLNFQQILVKIKILMTVRNWMKRFLAQIGPPATLMASSEPCDGHQTTVMLPLCSPHLNHAMDSKLL